MGKRKQSIVTKFFEIIILIFTSILIFVIWIVLSTPDALKIKSCLTTKMYKVKLCNHNSDYVPLSSFSSDLKNLLIIAEDASFYSHHGFDWAELQNSFEKNYEDLKIARGGSTITQQLAKNVFLRFDRTFVRKIKEALLTAQLEHILSKGEILEKYMNVIELGPNLYGFEKAAKHYFNKPASELNVLESAFLVYLIPNPKVYSNVFNKKELTQFSRYRLLDLVYRLFRFHKISADQYLFAKEYVDQFPWANLSASEIAQLGGVGTASQHPDASNQNSLPSEPTPVFPDVTEQLVPDSDLNPEADDATVDTETFDK